MAIKFTLMKKLKGDAADLRKRGLSANWYPIPPELKDSEIERLTNFYRKDKMITRLAKGGIIDSPFAFYKLKFQD